MDITHVTLKADLDSDDEYLVSPYNRTLTVEGPDAKVEFTLPAGDEDCGLVINRLVGCLEDIRAILPASIR